MKYLGENITYSRNKLGILKFQYRPGNVGIILSIPHGGLKDDLSIPERTDGYEMPNHLQDINVSYWLTWKMGLNAKNDIQTLFFKHTVPHNSRSQTNTMRIISITMTNVQPPLMLVKMTNCPSK